MKNNINPKLITMNRQTNEELRNYYQILNKDQVKVFYLTQIHDNICEIIWKLYLERYPNTEIPSKQVIEISDYCSDFTYNDLGRIALRLSHKEILNRSEGKISPLVKAWHAFDYLYGSPLKFERKSKAEDTSYSEIRRSCEQLDRDFNNNSKWTN